MNPTARFEELLAAPDEGRALTEAVLLIAAHDHAVDVDAELARLDELAEACPTSSLDGVLAQLFETEGFRGDERDYHHPDNSFLDRVLDRHRGLPILLSVLTIDVAAGVGVTLLPVGLPGHFLLRDSDDPGAFIDPFRGGARLTSADCREIFTSLHPGRSFRQDFLEPIPARAVLERVTNNLVSTFVERKQMRSLAWVLHLRALITGGEAWLSAAKMAERTGRWLIAAEAWERLARVEGADAEAALIRAASARARTN